MLLRFVFRTITTTLAALTSSAFTTPSAANDEAVGRACGRRTVVAGLSTGSGCRTLKHWHPTDVARARSAPHTCCRGVVLTGLL